jgi:hypothetical protein
MRKKATVLTRPASERQDTLFHERGRNSEQDRFTFHV